MGTKRRVDDGLHSVFSDSGDLVRCPGCARLTELEHRTGRCARCGFQLLDSRCGNWIDRKRIRLLYRLGQGGFGVVYRAHHSHPPPGKSPHVAVKVLHPKLAEDGDIVENFETEIEAICRFQHPGKPDAIGAGIEVIPPRHAGLREERLHWMAMELCTGHALEDILDRARKRGQRLRIPLVVSIMHQVAEVVIKAHRAGIVHRDIHPNNIALEFGEFDEITVTVLDFGIAHLVGPGKADHDYILGRKNWMSPEQAAGGTIDRRSDIFNLGILLYTLLTGRQPYPDGFKRSGRLPRRLPPPSVATKGDAEIVQRFDEVTLRALRLDRSERYRTAEEFLGALDGVLDTRQGPRRGLMLATVLLILAAAVVAVLTAT